MKRRVVITGVGCVTSLGVGIEPTWAGLVAGRSGLQRSTRIAPGAFACSLAGEVREFTARDFVPKSYRKATKVMAKDTELAVAAAHLAVKDAGIVTREQAEGGGATPTYPPGRVGCHIGAGLIAAETDELSSALASSCGGEGASDNAGGFSLRRWGTGGDSSGGMNNLPPLWMLKYLPNMLACHVTIIHGAEGPSNTLTCAEASGLLCAGESARVIERGAADICFAGSAESKLNHMGFLRQGLAGRLADTGDSDDASSVMRPYDAASKGTVLGEAAGILILEEAASAKARGRTPYATLLGFGAAHSGGAGLAILPDGSPNDGLVLAIERALNDAGVSADQIDAIVPQACGVPVTDAAEAGALREVFGDRLASIPLVTLAPMIGECAAGNGGVHLGVAAMCMREQTIPARLHAGTPAPGLAADASPTRQAPLRHVLVCSGSLGGQNAALVLGRAAS